MPDAPRIADDPFNAPGGRIGDRPRVHETLRRAGPLVGVQAPAGGPAWIITDEALAREMLAELERDRSGQQSRRLASLPTWLRSEQQASRSPPRCGPN